MRDRRFENQNYRASGLNLVVAAIILWNTVYLERVIAALEKQSKPVREDLIPHISPQAWEHINLTGDYTWKLSRRVAAGQFRSTSEDRAVKMSLFKKSYNFFRLVP